MYWNRFAMNPFWGLLGLAVLLFAALLSLGSDVDASSSLSAVSADGVAVGKLGVQGPPLPAPDPVLTTLDHRIFLPTLANRFPRLELDIYDWTGNLQTWDWLIWRFGAVWLHRGSGAASVGVLREEASGQTVLIARVDRNGQPVQDVPVMFYWPDAPWLEPELQACGLERALVVHTNGDGEAHFGMGLGSAYWPPGGGPHIVWVGGPGSDCLGGLGWLGGTNHIHLNSVWELP